MTQSDEELLRCVKALLEDGQSAFITEPRHADQ
jgi:hypothetical protein